MLSASRYVRAAGVVTAGVLATALLSGTPASAQLAFTLDPSDPGPGEEFVLSGTGCIWTAEQTGEPEDITGLVTLALTDAPLEFASDVQEHPDRVEIPAEDDGSWSVELMVPADADPDQELHITMACLGFSFFTGTGSFSVGTPSGPETPATTEPAAPGVGAPPGTSSEPPSEPPAATATPAEPAPGTPGEPDFTG